ASTGQARHLNICVISPPLVVPVLILKAMANEIIEQLAEQVRQLQADYTALAERVQKIENERKREKDKQSCDDLQFRSAGG
ncbi:MAG: hypothetical protein WAN71_23080, partial [Mycobacterium sp.]|uniref:hypothetical protein n=1 Tax=Mycobacterium sp. TaxID=1785 RepID=UPI003BAF79DE